MRKPPPGQGGGFDGSQEATFVDAIVSPFTRSLQHDDDDEMTETRRMYWRWRALGFSLPPERGVIVIAGGNGHATR